MSEQIAAIILGASQWPNCPHLAASPNFKNSADQFACYLASHLCPDAENFLDLFDDTRTADEIDQGIDSFLAARFSANVRNVIVYYVGHGAFTEGDQNFCLPVRRSRHGALGQSAYRM